MTTSHTVEGLEASQETVQILYKKFKRTAHRARLREIHDSVMGYFSREMLIHRHRRQEVPLSHWSAVSGGKLLVNI